MEDKILKVIGAILPKALIKKVLLSVMDKLLIKAKETETPIDDVILSAVRSAVDEVL